ncbi:ComEA family DNA-binding protein [Thiomicrorhabdus chilensis]|uniref:ComEA family DNA-binding protein n=1 Tax=Thiomicrorhabdus chilensis TaxID=63656 RepID=UPI000416A104|nr:helix-hairpin-helix domain-containing protein [Thiomicrorhabdus chilensis]
MFSRMSVLIGAMLVSFSVLASPVNVNSAAPEEIAAALKGIGPSKSMAISEYCKQNKCSKPEDLLNVKGIGEKTLEKIKADLRF